MKTAKYLPRFSKKENRFYSQKTLDTTKLSGKSRAKKQIHLDVNMAETLLASQLLKTCARRREPKKKDGNTNVF